MSAPQDPIPTDLVCQKCGYNLTGVTLGGLCPGCGAPAADSFTPQELPTNKFANTALILGVISLTTCAFAGIVGGPAGICAVVFGILARVQISEGAYAPKSRSHATAGIICGIIGVVLNAALFVITILAG